MTLVEAILLGVVQGVTEFLPISSSGHLVLCQSVLKIKQPGNEFEILVHFGTLASILVVFYDDIRSLLLSLKSKKTQIFLFFILIGTLPAAGIGWGFKDIFESLFQNVMAVGVALIFTGFVLCGSSFSKRENKDITTFSSFLIGIAQAIAIIPGVSRSGMTISLALILGLPYKKAARFSFLLAIPTISGAALLSLLDSNGEFLLSLPVVIGGLISSFVVGIIALTWLLSVLEKGKLHYFGVYCFAIGLVTIVINIWI